MQNECEQLQAQNVNELQHRILWYLQGIRSNGINLVNTLLDYYENKIVLNDEYFEREFKIFLQAGIKPNYYKTDKEIQNILPQIEEDIYNANTIEEMNRSADQYVFWSKIIGEDYVRVLKVYKEEVHKKLAFEGGNRNDGISDYGYDFMHFETEEVKNVYQEERSHARETTIQKYIDYLHDTTKGKQAFDYSYRLRECCQSTFYQNIIKKFSDKLYNRKSFPVDEIDVQQYHTCYNIMRVLYCVDDKKFLEYADKLSKECDKMSVHRMENMIGEIVKNII